MVEIKVEGHTPAKVYADKPQGEHSGLGIYDIFIYVDIRANKSRFDYP